VSRRLSFADLPEEVLGRIIQNDFLNEGHTVEICKLSILDILANWLTRETAMLEVIDKVLSKCTKATPPLPFA
jgi:hypothetical protein